MIANTDDGQMIVPRFDFILDGNNLHAGVGWCLLERGEFEQELIDLCIKILVHRKAYHRLTVIDCGANVGSFTVSVAKAIAEFGDVIAIEPQERIFYALCGNITINDLGNASAINCAASDKSGTLDIPVVDYSSPGAFGCVSLKGDGNIGQKINKCTKVRATAIDDLDLKGCDLIKLDVEKMEPEVLRGAEQTIMRFKPVIIAEWEHCGQDAIKESVPYYRWDVLGDSLLGAMPSDSLWQVLVLNGMIDEQACRQAS